jgi:hypothetical protein
MFGTVNENLWEEVSTTYAEGDDLQIVLLGMEMGPGGMMTLDAEYKKATPAALWVNISLKGGGGRMLDVPIQWGHIRLVGKTSALKSALVG